MVTSSDAVARPVRHDLNDAFDWVPARAPFRRLTAAQAASYDELGYVVIEDAFDAATVAEVIAEIDPLERELEDGSCAGRRRQGLHRPRRRDHLHHAPRRPLRRACAASCAEPALRDLCADLDRPRRAPLLGPGRLQEARHRAPFPWHQDNGYAFVEPQQYLTCWIALTDATEDNGCPWVVPGLHRIGTLRHRPRPTLGWSASTTRPRRSPRRSAPASIVVFSSLTPHCTGPNLTDDVRKAYIVQYAPDGAVVLAGPDRDHLQRTPPTRPTASSPCSSPAVPRPDPRTSRA